MPHFRLKRLGCFHYRVKQPLNELKRFNVEYTCIAELPFNPFGSQPPFCELLGLFAQFDLIIIQRCYDFTVCKVVRDACDFLCKPLIFDTDDDYFHLPTTNPGYKSIVENEKILPAFAQALSFMDGITVSTEELRQVIYKFNKNVKVLPNNMSMLFCGEHGPVRRSNTEEVLEDGKVKIKESHGMISVPSFRRVSEDTPSKKTGIKILQKIIRIGYTGTPTHKEDYETVYRNLEKVLGKFKSIAWGVFIGDRYFFDKVNTGVGRVLFVPPCPYDLYMYQISNFDIGIAPLAPNMFNMSKSPIKALEYASWGVPSILPNYVTYTREFTHNENCLMYNNSFEFAECLEALVTDEELRLKLGRAARDLVKNKRLERDHAEERYEFYKQVIASKNTLYKFLPEDKEAQYDS